MATMILEFAPVAVEARIKPDIDSFQIGSKQITQSHNRTDERLSRNTEEIMLPEDDRVTPKRTSALAPFPRSTWIHPHVPNDNFDRVCKIIWRRAKEAEEEFGRGQNVLERPQKKDSSPLNDNTSHRADVQQKETDDLSVSAQYKEDRQHNQSKFTLSCPYLSGNRHPHVAKLARVLNPVMEEEMKLNEEGAERKTHLEKAKQKSVENSLKTIWVPESRSRTDKHSSAFEQQATNPICSARENPELHLLFEEEPRVSTRLSRDACESEGEQTVSCISDSNSSDNDFAPLPGVRSYATDSSDDDLARDNNECEVEENENPHSFSEICSESEQVSLWSSAEKDFPPLSTVRAGDLPRLVGLRASGKTHNQWEIPLSFHPHNIPADTLAGGLAAPVQAALQGKARTPWANSKTNAPLAVPTQQESYDLLADFPVLQPPERPLALGVLHDGNPKTEDTKGKRELTHPPNYGQETSHQRRMENVPHEVFSICTGDQKSVLDLQTFGSISQCISPIISCEELKANNQPPPGVAGTDGVGVNARSWASTAKMGMEQAAAPQEKARPCSFQQIVNINRAKAVHFVPQTFTNKVIPFHQGANPLVTGLCYGHQFCNPKRFVRPGHPPIYQHVEAQARRANCLPFLSNRPEVICPSTTTCDDSHCDAKCFRSEHC